MVSIIVWMLLYVGDLISIHNITYSKVENYIVVLISDH